jgi:hypothetical protein
LRQNQREVLLRGMALIHLVERVIEGGRGTHLGKWRTLVHTQIQTIRMAEGRYFFIAVKADGDAVWRHGA